MCGRKFTSRNGRSVHEQKHHTTTQKGNYDAARQELETRKHAGEVRAIEKSGGSTQRRLKLWDHDEEQEYQTKVDHRDSFPQGLQSGDQVAFKVRHSKGLRFFAYDVEAL